MPKEYSNELLSVADIDKNRLSIDGSQGFGFPLTVLQQILRLEADQQHKNSQSFQCPCGMLFVVERDFLKDQSRTDKNGNILCPKCGHYQISVRRESNFPDLNPGLTELLHILTKAREENTATLCYFLYSSLQLGREQMEQIRSSASLMLDLTAKHALELELSRLNLISVEYDHEYMRAANITLQLNAFAHLYESSPFYDILLSLLLIADGKHRLLSDNGRRIEGVGATIPNKKDSSKDGPVGYKIEVIKDYCEENGHAELKKLIDLVFDSKIRNAFSHSQYLIIESGISLTRYELELSDKELSQKLFGIFMTIEYVLSFIDQERRSFMASDGVVEDGVRIKPLVDGNRFAVEMRSPP